MSILCLRIRRFLERPVSEGSGTPQGPPEGVQKGVDFEPKMGPQGPKMAKIAIFATTYLLFCIFGPFLTLFLDPIFGPPVKSCPGGAKRGSGMPILCLRIRQFLERPVLAILGSLQDLQKALKNGSIFRFFKF